MVLKGASSPLSGRMPGLVLRYIVVGVLLLLTGSYIYHSRSLYHTSRYHPGGPGPHHVTHLRILPLGDSITYGYNDPTGNSYRYFLECLLSQSPNSPFTHAVQYTGSIIHGSWPNARNHGLTLHGIQQIRQNLILETTSGSSYISTPNVILLNIGTVDIIANRRLHTLPNLLSQLLELMHAQWPSALVIVSSLVPSPDEPTDERLRDFNAALPDVVREASLFRGQKVMFASMDSIRKHDVVDGVHPNGTAYAKMAARWHAAISGAERAGLITPLPKADVAEVRAQAVTSAESLGRCQKVFAELERGVAVVDGEVEDRELGDNKNIDLYT